MQNLMGLLLSLSIMIFLIDFCASSFSDEEYVRAFEDWTQEHGKKYDEHERKYRLRVFKSNMDFVQSHNEKGEHSFRVKLNKFADLTNTEFRERFTGFHHRLIRIEDPKHVFDYDSTIGTPVSVDWRDEGVVTGVKDQGSCGSCWSFSTTGSVEGAWALNYSLVSLSEQNLMDCSLKYGNLGCNGGLMDNAFEYIIDNNGIATEESYPYEESTDFECEYQRINRGATISDYKDVTSGSEDALQTAVAYRGPVSVAIDAGHLSFQLYDEGVYFEERCSDSELDHGVLAVGYGLSTEGEYWIVKNSWGTSWGEDGYIRMARNQDNNCGIATQASFPIV